MAAFRLADFIDIHEGRAPRELELTRRLRSPVSVIEHRANQCVESIRRVSHTPSWLLIEAGPKDPEVFLHLRKWIDNLQAEIDAICVALAELRVDSGSVGGINVTRVISSLDDLSTLDRSVDYVPADVHWSVAENDVVRLLVNPLYGDAPEFAIRELVQNAVDAVRERDAILSCRPPAEEHQAFSQLPDVVVTVERDHEDRFWVAVEDSGVGMELSTVRDFFLRVGATFRMSPEWRTRFEVHPGEPSILRSGRFGIGVLAAFLLGAEVEVTTRHMSLPESAGLRFLVRHDRVQVPVYKCARSPGTTLRVQVSHSTWHHLITHTDEWDWYHLSKPTVLRQFLDKGQVTELESRFELPEFGARPPLHWHCVRTTDFPETHWTLAEGSAPELCCNGIEIRPAAGKDYLSRLQSRLVFDYRVARPGLLPRRELPKLSVYDPGARLPLNLQRTGLTSVHVPPELDEELYRGVIRNVTACLLVSAPTGPPHQKDGLKRYRELVPLGYPGAPGFRLQNYLSYEDARWLPWFFTRHGVAPSLYWHLTHSGLRSALLVALDDSLLFSNAPLPRELTAAADAVLVFYVRSKPTYMLRWIRFALREKAYGMNPFDALQAGLAGVLVPRAVSAQVRNLKRFPKGLRDAIHSTETSEAFEIWSLSNGSPMESKFAEAVERIPEAFLRSVIGLGMWSVRPIQEQLPLSPLEREWRESLGVALIPFDGEDRGLLAKRAKQRLGAHIESHEVLCQEWRAGTRRGAR